MVKDRHLRRRFPPKIMRPIRYPAVNEGYNAPRHQ